MPFNSNGHLISGWHWLRSAGHTATWTFDGAKLAGADPTKVYINVTALVTNGVNGGSGFDTPLRLQVAAGSTTQTVTVALKNPFKPKITDFRRPGLHLLWFRGAVVAEDREGKRRDEDHRLLCFTSKGYHVAVNTGSVSLGFARK